jgi:hypothetical protein
MQSHQEVRTIREFFFIDLTKMLPRQSSQLVLRLRMRLAKVIT